MEVYLKLKNLILTLIATAVCFALVYAPSVRANENGDMKGMLNGKTWNMKLVTLKKKMNSGVPVIELEFFEKDILDTEICKDNLKSNNLLIQIPLNIRNDSAKSALDYEGADIQLGLKRDNSSSMLCYHELELNEKELNSKGLAFVSGRLELVSQRTKTEVIGTFKARVCNSVQNI